MGNDGGSIPKRDDLIKIKKEQRIVNNLEILKERFKSCSFNNEPFKKPIVICRRGFLFNKETLYEAIIKKNLPKELSYLKKMKDTREIKFMFNSDKNSDYRICCPVSGKTVNGINHFVCVWSCGCLILEKIFFTFIKTKFTLNDISKARKRKDMNPEFTDKKFKCPNCSCKFSLFKLLSLNMNVTPEESQTVFKNKEFMKGKLTGKRAEPSSALEAIQEVKEKYKLKKVKTEQIKVNEPVLNKVFHKEEPEANADQMMFRFTKHGLR